MERFQQIFQLFLLLLVIPWLEPQDAGEVCQVALTKHIYVLSCDRRNLTEKPMLPMLTSPYHLNMSFNLLNNVDNILLSFENAKFMKILDLSHNLIREVHTEAFNSLRNLKVLNMSHNYLEKLPKMCFNELRKLQFLSLSNNQIVSLSSEHFTGLVSTRNLYLVNNRLCEISSHFLETLRSLKMLDLSNNKLNGTMLRRLRRVAATRRKKKKGNTFLKTLILSGNPLTTVSEGDFQNLNITKALIMSSCKITDFVGSPFRKLSTLKKLDLRNNSLTFIDVTTLKGLTSLLKLNLKDNKVSKWDSSIKIDTLKHLNLRSNEIQSLNFFSNLQLHDLQLSKNSISVVDDRTVRSFLHGINKFSLSANPFRCSCENERLRSWLVNANERRILIDSLSNYRCHSPLSFQGVQLESADICKTKLNENTTTSSIDVHDLGLKIAPDINAKGHILHIAYILIGTSVMTIILFFIGVTIIVLNKFKTTNNRFEIGHKSVPSAMLECDSSLPTKRKNMKDLVKLDAYDHEMYTGLNAPEKGYKGTANIEPGQLASVKRTIHSRHSRNLNMISSGTSTTTDRNFKTETCVNLGTATNAVVLDAIVRHINENTEMENDQSFLPTRQSTVTQLWKDTKTDGYTTSLADENSKCSTSDTAHAVCKGPIQHYDSKKGVMLPLPFDVGQVNGKFKEAIFDHNGGHLTLENYGVSLFVPPGAIEYGVSQAVSIELTYDKEHMPHLMTGEAVIGPVVICRPSGLIFKESVVLSYPHCGSGQNKIKHLVSDTDRSEPVYYRDSSDGKDTITFVMDGSCLRIIDHFTLYTSVTEGQVTKAFMIFADLRNKDCITLRIWIVNNTEDALKEVTNNHEFRKKGTELFGPKPYTIDSTSGDLQIEFKEVMDGWSAPNTVKIPLKRILEYAVDHEQMIVCRKGCLSAKSDAVSMIVCAYQLQNSNAESVNMPIYIDVSQGSQAKMGQTSHDGTCTGTTKPLPAALPLGLCQRICLHMDSTEPLANDWRKLAEKIGLSMPDIQLLESNKATKSPTRVLLNIWQKKRRGVKMEHFQELTDLFHKIERHDVVRYISKFIKVFEKDGLEAADQAIAPSSESQMVLAGMECNDTEQCVMEAEGEDQSEDQITQSRSQPHSNYKLAEYDDGNPEKSTQIWTEKSCHQEQSQNSFPVEQSAIISSKDTSNEENVTGLCGDIKVALEDSSLLRSDSGYYSKFEVNGNESES